jgi:hypothetical protein
VTVSADQALRVGTLSGVVGDVAVHLGVTRDELVQRLFGQPERRLSLKPADEALSLARVGG